MYMLLLGTTALSLVCLLFILFSSNSYCILYTSESAVRFACLLALILIYLSLSDKLMRIWTCDNACFLWEVKSCCLKKYGRLVSTEHYIKEFWLELAAKLGIKVV